MPRLIDADTLKEQIDHILLIWNAGRAHGKRLLEKAIREYTNAVSKKIETAPTVDAVPVIRCRDCKYNDGIGGQCPVQSTGDPFYNYKPEDNWFCADGERRDNG